MIRAYHKNSAASCSLIVPTRDDEAHYLSAADLAKLQLPGLPRSKRGIQFLAERSGWTTVERRLAGGLTRLYAIADLPDEAQQELKLRQTARQPLARRGRGRPSGTDWAELWPETADAVEVLYIERRLSAGVILDILSADPDGRYPNLPSVRSLHRFLRRVEAEQAALVASIRNPDRYKGRYRLALGRADGACTYAGEVWELDTTKADLMTVGGRVMVLGVIDRWSRRANFMVAPSESGQSVRRFLVETIRKWGILPSAVMTDNGSGYINAAIRSALESLGIEHRICPPGSPEKKPFVERLFGTFSRERLPILSGFAGHNVAQAQELRARAKKETGRAIIAEHLTPTQLQEILTAWVDGNYNVRPHGTTRVAPLQRWLASPVPATAAPSEDVLKVALSALVGTRKVTKRGITWAGGRYWAPSLATWMDRDVVVRRDEDDLGALFIFAPDGTFIDTAVNHQRTGLSEQQWAQEARRQQADHDKVARADWRRKKAALNPEAAIQSLLRREAEAAGSVIPLPIPSVPATTPTIDSLSDATRGNSTAMLPDAGHLPALPAVVVDHPATPRARMIAADAVIARADAGEPVDEAELRRARTYAATTEYRAQRLMAEQFGHQTGTGRS